MKIYFAERLRQLRTDEGLKQAELAERIDTTQRKISYMEAGHTEPDLLTLWKLCDYFEVSADYMLGRKEY